ncbi:craniofacial development protein 2-like [Palaemon carinicauda]|uniref:craniofacial development protein 2-like n=1 Tax=Palaemon carinicauda TaxID=392227 RepID=UPI0035B57D56
MDETQERDMKIVIGDFNAKFGRNNQEIVNLMDVKGHGEVANVNGAHFISVCSTNNLVIEGTLFLHKDIHKYTWTSLWDYYKNQLDHRAIDKEWRNHQPLIATLKLKLKAPNRNVDRIRRVDTTRLLEEEHREIFAIECRN